MGLSRSVNTFENQRTASMNMTNDASASTAATNLARLHLLRGPVLTVVAIISFLWPYWWNVALFLLAHTYLIAHLGIAVVGLVLFGLDAWKYIQRNTKQFIVRICNLVAVDDVLRAVYDPTTGLVANVVGGVVGTSSMYALGMNEAQRTEMFQSSLGLNKTDAQTLLMKKGGFCQFLPDGIQQWLQDEEEEPTLFVGMKTQYPSIRPKLTMADKVNEAPPSSGGTFDGSEMGSVVCDFSDLEIEREWSPVPSSVPAAVPPPSPLDENFSPSSNSGPPNSTSRSCAVQNEESRQQYWQQQQEQDSDPILVFFKILRKIALERLKPSVERLPCGTIENVGVVAALGLGLQLVLRRRAKKGQLWGALCALALSSVASLSVGTVLAREAMLGKIHNQVTLQLAGKQLALRLWNKVKENMLHTHKAKTALAFLVFCLVARRRQPSLQKPSNFNGR